MIEGDLLTAVTAQAANFFKLVWPSSTPVLDPTPAGVRLPNDDLAGVSIRDFAPNGYIQSRTIQAVAFGSFLDEDGRVRDVGANANGEDAEDLLAFGTRIVPAADTFRVAFADLATQQLALFIATDERGGDFDNQSIVFVVQGIGRPNASLTDNIVTSSNVARGAATALVTVMPTYDSHGRQQDSVVQTIAIRGDGASIETQQWISQSITSTGPLGDLTLTAHNGITDITAPSIFGSIIGGPITGTVQTTGLRTDPITSAVTTVSADIGRVYIAFDHDHDSPHLTTTVIDVDDGISGRLISRGNLISEIDGKVDVTGVIAVQGNFGANLVVAGKTVRLGGMTVDGQLNGAVVVLGQQLADVTIHGGFKDGIYAVKGGIVGNLVIDGSFNDNGILVSGAQIGDVTQGTTLTYNGNNKGIIAAIGTIRFAKGVPRGSVFSNVTGANAAAINAIFTNSGSALAFDVTGLDLQGLSLILLDLNKLIVTSSGGLSGPTP